MRPVYLFTAFIAAFIFFSACGGSHQEEADYVYDEGLLLNDDLVAYRTKDGKISIWDTSKKKVTIKDIDLDWTTPSPNDSLAVFCTAGRRGYYNVYTGEIVVPAQYRRAWIFKDGLAAVQKNGNIGFINSRGEVVIDFKFPYHGNPLCEFIFSNDHCVVADKAGKCGVIDKAGAWLIPPEYDFVSAYKDYAIVTKEGIAMQMGYGGEVINAFVLDNLKELSYVAQEVMEGQDGSFKCYERTVQTGLYAYCIGGRYGLMDGRTMTRLTEPLYKKIRAVSGTMFLAYLLDSYSVVILNEKGEVMK